VTLLMLHVFVCPNGATKIVMIASKQRGAGRDPSALLSVKFVYEVPHQTSTQIFRN
jgi:hypothetical protein